MNEECAICGSLVDPAELKLISKSHPLPGDRDDLATRGWCEACRAALPVGDFKQEHAPPISNNDLAMVIMRATNLLRREIRWRE